MKCPEMAKHILAAPDRARLAGMVPGRRASIDLQRIGFKAELG